MQDVDYADAEKTFIARVAGCIRSGMSVADALQHSSKVGWVHKIGDNDRKGKAWKWPGPSDYVIGSEFWKKVNALIPASEKDFQKFIGTTYQACTKIGFRKLADSLLADGISKESYEALKKLGSDLEGFFDEQKVASVTKTTTIFSSSKE